ncbi:MAG: chlorophyll synthesis pathway protein BchC [Burkholderiaceae bacterium]|nr:MAG: chlorophyll synthesis pathway protein BchC [Burkholderiaceae bacterium]
MKVYTSMIENKASVVLLKKPGEIRVEQINLDPLTEDDLLVENFYSGISSGTERLLFEGRMPTFQGMGYPLVPGYECFGKVSACSEISGFTEGDTVFVPGATCYGDVKGLFGGASSHLVVNKNRAIKMPFEIGSKNVLLALAATAHHIFADKSTPDLIIGHGALGRLLARLTVLRGKSPIVVDKTANRISGAVGYEVCTPGEVVGKQFGCIVDVSGDLSQLDFLISLLHPGGEVVLAGFYQDSISFDFVPTFLKEARIRVSAQWQQSDLQAVSDLVISKQLDLEGIISHEVSAENAPYAYETAFNDTSCLKMIIDWKGYH